jgi:hypothetical protein
MNKLVIATIPSLAFLVAGCDEKPAAPAKPAAKSNTGAAPAAPSGASSLDTLKEKANSAAASASSSASQLKDQAVAAFSTTYDDIKKQISGLKDKAPTVPDSVKTTYNSAMTSLDNLVKEADAKFEQLKASHPDEFQKAKDAVDSVVAKIKDGIASAQKTLSPPK